MIEHEIYDGINFNIYDGKLGVSVSGGADSALVLFFLLKFNKSKIHIFTFADQQKQLINTKSAIDVVNTCIQLTGNSNLEHHIDYGEIKGIDTLFRNHDLYLKNKIVDYVYTGITKNPPKEVTDSFLEEVPVAVPRDPDVIRDVLWEGSWYRPWTNLNKRDLYNIYKKHNLLDTLFPKTRSCEFYNTDIQEMEEFIRTHKHCGSCWWCEERMWGFGRL